MDDFMNHEPKWINPCGFPNNDNPSSSDGPTIDPRDSLKRIILQANIALTGAQGFKHDFADKTFHSDFESMIDAYKDSKFDWLPTEEQVPKNLGENLPDEFLANLEIDSFLVNSYEYLQKLAVAMEQIVEDKKKGNEPFGPNFVKSEADLRNLLCEIRLAIDSRKIERKPDVTRDIMSDQYRQYGSTTDRNMRHFLIYRDFINILEFVVQSFSHLINQNILK